MKTELKNCWIVHHIGYQCDNNCKFCIVQDRLKQKQPSLQELLNDMSLIDKVEKYYFTGGEPTLRKDLSILIDYAKQHSENVLLQTNARNFSDKEYAKEIINKGIKGVMVSMHVHDEKTGEFLLGDKNAFKETVKALENLLKEDIEIVTNTVISKYNYLELDKTIEFITGKFPGLDRVRLIYASFNKYNSKEHYIPLRFITQPVIKLLERYGSILEIENVPLCVVDSKKYGANFEDHNKLVALGNGKLSTSSQRKFIQECEDCSVRKHCQGLYRNYDYFFDPTLDIKKIK